ncbi:MAG: hypothetical protein QOE27_1876, partial [Solirubrobacteraceae bacterium]|nr:hypothetical protein [Solirubrobacteraceae bacterium]
MGSPHTSPPDIRVPLEPAPARSGLPPRPTDARSFADDQELLGWALGEVIRDAEGEEAFELHERSVSLASRAREGDAGAADELADLVG